MKWWQLRLPVSWPIEEACSNRLQEIGAIAVFTDSSDENLSKGGVISLVLNGIFPLEADPVQIKQDLLLYLSSLQDLGFEVPSSEINCQQINEDEYLHQWKEYFQPVYFDHTLVVEPVWTCGSARSGEKTLKIDPGMAFGTGQHFTTKFCLQWICRHRDQFNSFIDIGCGSGILAIAASMLGVEKVVAIDHDPTAILAGQRNVEINNLTGKINFLAAGILSLPLQDTFEVVMANLHTNLLIEAKDKLVSLLKPKASLILTGINCHHQQELLETYQELSCQLIEEDPQREWVGLWFIRR